MSSVQLEHVNGTPVFVSYDENPNFIRVHGHNYDKENRRWLFPAYPPFGLLAANDLKKAFPTLSYTPEAVNHIEHLKSVAQRIKERTLPEGFSFVTPPFEHQIEAVCYLVNHPRFALYFDAGTGKTKILIDLKRCFPDKKMLVLTPKITVQNWVKETEVHSSKSVKAAAVLGTPAQKRNIIAGYKDYDILVCSYGTTRNLGFPTLYEETEKFIASTGATASSMKSVGKAVSLLSDPSEQLGLAKKWAEGQTIADTHREAVRMSEETAQWISDIKYDIIVADESHNLSNISSQQTKIALALSKKASRRYLMSGTPTLGDPRHFYPQMKFLAPSIIPEDWFKFMDMFLVRSPWNKHIVTGYKNLNILNERVQRVSIRKRKDECLDLPARTIIDVPVALSSEQTRLYNELVSEMSVELNQFFNNQTDTLAVQNAAVLLNKLAQITSGFVINSHKKAEVCDVCPHLTKCVEKNIQPYTQQCEVIKEAPETSINFLSQNPKLDALEGLLDNIFANEQSKVIIWCLYTAEIDAITELLDKKKIKFVRMSGGSGGDIQKKIDRFNTDKECRAYVGQIATGIGITLNAATYTIYFSLGWSLGHYLQSIDRNYRAGQTQKVTVYRLLAEGTVDAFKAVALNEKKDLSAMLTNKLACATCERSSYCLKNGIELFDEGCIYPRAVSRTVAKARTIDAPDTGKRRNRRNTE